MNRGLKAVRFRRDDALARLKWDRLECVVADYYREIGYDVEHVGTGRTGSKFDGGIDLKLRKDGEYVLVQCKHWNAYKVTHTDVHQLLGLVVNEDATGGILVNSGEFTKAAVEAAGRRGRIQLIDGDELRAMLGPIADEQSVTVSVTAPRRTAADGFVANAAERLVAAAEHRVRHGSGRTRRGRDAATAALLSMLLKFLFTGLVLLLFLGAINKVFRGIADDAAARSAQQREQLRQAQAKRTSSAPQPIASVGQGTRAQDTPTGPVAEVGSTRTEAERREWRRRNAEAMKILEATTPELPRKPVAPEGQWPRSQ